MSEERDPLTFDADWEARAESILADVEFDTDLGIELAKDAQRVVADEMDEAAFHEKYHEAILSEFGEDERELADVFDGLGEGVDEAQTGLGEKLTSLADDDQSRRELLVKGGAAALGLSVLAGAGDDTARAGSPADDDDEGVQWGMTINLNNCDGCLACMVACEQENHTSAGANWMYVFTYEDDFQDDENFLIRPCQHCSDAPCEKVCPVGARHTREKDGLVLTDYDICIGCRYCQVSCPYGVNYFQWGHPDTPQDALDPTHTHDERDKWVDSRPPKGVMGKCTMCPSRQDGLHGEEKIGTTACADACTMDAIHFGDMNDPDSDPNTHLEQYRTTQENDRSDWSDRPGDTMSTFRLLEERGTDPNVVYIGNEPSENARQVEGPVAYEDMGLVDNRKLEVLDDGAAATDGGEDA